MCTVGGHTRPALLSICSVSSTLPDSTASTSPSSAVSMFASVTTHPDSFRTLVHRVEAEVLRGSAPEPPALAPVEGTPTRCGSEGG